MSDDYIQNGSGGYNDSDDYNNFVKRRIHQQKLRRKARRGEIAIKRIFKLFRFIITIAIFFGLYKLYSSHYWIFPHGVLSDSERIHIAGNMIVPSEIILAEMKKFPPDGKPVYKLNPDVIARNIEQLSPVKRAYVRRFWLPARLSVMVEEVTPAIIIAPSEDAPEVAAFSHDGRLIGREYLPFNFKNGAIMILSYGTNGDDYEKWDSEKINKLYKLAKLIEEYSGEPVEYLDLRNPHNAFAKIPSTKIRLGEIDVSLNERIKPIREILPVIKTLDSPVQYVDLNWKDSQYIKMAQ